jgi:hypothetical protein
MNWSTAANFATAVGTLVLAVATFASIRSSARSARTAERSLLIGLRPLLIASRLQDPDQKVGWGDRHWAHLEGAGAVAEIDDGRIYLAMSVRNAGSGIAVMQSWEVITEWRGAETPAPDPAAFRSHTRDLYVAPDDISFWQAALRDQNDPSYAPVAALIEQRERIVVDVLYTDHEGGQPSVTRYLINPRNDDKGWLCSAVRHYYFDRPNPR